MNTNSTEPGTSHPTATTARRPAPARRELADVVVVGGRCAGAATAMLLARLGHDVLVVDRAAPGDTLSTHGISRSGVVQLHRWGLLEEVVASGAPPVRDVIFHVDGTSTERRIKDRAGVDFLIAPRRGALDPILLGAAAAAGARVRTGVTVDGVCRAADGRVVGVHGRDDNGPIEITARFVIGADGLRSRIARSVDARFDVIRPATGATHYAYFAGNWSAIEYFRGDDILAGVFPTHDGEACIWVCMPSERAERIRRSTSDPRAAFDTMIATGPAALAERLGGATRRGTARGMVRLPNHVRHPVGPGWALVGDAGYHRDAITGHGISDAFRDAELLAEAVDLSLRGQLDETSALAHYHATRDEMLSEIFEITCELSRFPPAHRFVELQKQLGRAIEREADCLAARPTPAVLAAV